MGCQLVTATDDPCFHRSPLGDEVVASTDLSDYIIAFSYLLDNWSRFALGGDAHQTASACGDFLAIPHKQWVCGNLAAVAHCLMGLKIAFRPVVDRIDCVSLSGCLCEKPHKQWDCGDLAY